jgi:predicted N-acetyltransferase YhbS
MEFAVAAQHRSKGIGKALFESACKPRRSAAAPKSRSAAAARARARTGFTSARA